VPRFWIGKIYRKPRKYQARKEVEEINNVFHGCWTLVDGFQLHKNVWQHQQDDPLNCRWKMLQILKMKK
jgi:hypothetical protein